ncbi:MBL fold metallo-hydrolase [Parabacteroides pacaensis]|uniref:MBL fold metallo-hydrolase n=1 Tax=Parabacteroides pacaensis TaxID=2086575 RepID=UPI000D0F4D0C|nr:MBL fold metallo-hydrolase [Parabacteroides pacaensis]
MRITFLGTGTSTGVPEIGCQCEVCTSNDKRDRRLRTSILVETQGKKNLIDCGPDFRWQVLVNRITHLDGVLVTHEHYDHVGGLDDLRPFCRHHTDVNIYTEQNVADAIRTRIPYVFKENPYPGVPRLKLHEITAGTPFMVAGVKIIPIRVMHGRLPILGFRIGNFAYLTDLKTLPEEEFIKLQHLKVLVIDALRKEEHPTHASVDEAMQLVNRLHPDESYFIHMSHKIGLHAIVDKELPAHVHYSYDGLIVDIPEELPQAE